MGLVLRPDPDTLAPPRFLPEFDNLILSHADRTRIIANDYRKVIASKNGMVPATVLVDGFVRGTWKTERIHGKAYARDRSVRASAERGLRIPGRRGRAAYSFRGGVGGSRGVRGPVCRKNLGSPAGPSP